MKYAIIYSTKDTAGKNIAEELRELGKFEIIEFDKEIIYAENIDKKTEADFIIFASKHESEKGVKSLSVHSPGNWHKAELGGQDSKICQASAFLNKLMFQNLKKEAEIENLDYEITLECTHHGPYIETPCLFIEIGSSEEEWKDKKAGKIIAETIAKTIKEFENLKINWQAAIGLGGLHYCNNFNKIQLNSIYALGHIVPEYCLSLTESMLLEALKKTTEKNPIILLDWKGLGKSEQRQKVLDILNKLDLKYLRTSEIEK